METVFWILMETGLWSLSVEWKEAHGMKLQAQREEMVTCITAETLWYESLKGDYQKLHFDIRLSYDIIISVQHETTWFLIFSQCVIVNTLSCSGQGFKNK